MEIPFLTAQGIAAAIDEFPFLITQEIYF